jgi:hypothetical protein
MQTCVTSRTEKLDASAYGAKWFPVGSFRHHLGPAPAGPVNLYRRNVMSMGNNKPDDDMPDFSDVASGASSTAGTQATFKMYTIVGGDSLSKIAKREMGNANDWQKIFDANKDVIKDPNKIFPGQKIKIPL